MLKIDNLKIYLFNFKIVLYPYLKSFTDMFQVLHNTSKALEIIQKRKMTPNPFSMCEKEGR